jgi:hypothetical protein
MNISYKIMLGLFGLGLLGASYEMHQKQSTHQAASTQSSQEEINRQVMAVVAYVAELAEQDMRDMVKYNLEPGAVVQSFMDNHIDQAKEQHTYGLAASIIYMVKEAPGSNFAQKLGNGIYKLLSSREASLFSKEAKLYKYINEDETSKKNHAAQILFHVLAN